MAARTNTSYVFCLAIFVALQLALALPGASKAQDAPLSQTMSEVRDLIPNGLLGLEVFAREQARSEIIAAARVSASLAQECGAEIADEGAVPAEELVIAGIYGADVIDFRLGLTRVYNLFLKDHIGSDFDFDGAVQGLVDDGYVRLLTRSESGSPVTMVLFNDREASSVAMHRYVGMNAILRLRDADHFKDVVGFSEPNLRTFVDSASSDSSLMDMCEAAFVTRLACAPGRWSEKDVSPLSDAIEQTCELHPENVDAMFKAELLARGGALVGE